MHLQISLTSIKWERKEAVKERARKAFSWQGRHRGGTAGGRERLKNSGGMWRRLQGDNSTFKGSTGGKSFREMSKSFFLC